jgi:hypothetical protein
LKPVSQASPEQSNFALFLSANKQGDIVILSKHNLAQFRFLSAFGKNVRAAFICFYLLPSASASICLNAEQIPEMLLQADTFSIQSQIQNASLCFLLLLLIV